MLNTINNLGRLIVLPLILLSAFLFAEETDATKEQQMAVFLLQTKVPNGESQGTGFACRFKNQDFIATNLHVIDRATSISVRPQSGADIRLSGRMIVAGDADICLLGIVGGFEDFGIIPFEFAGDAFTESKVGDEIICLGNSLGTGVITATKGTIKAYGKPRLEIVSPVVEGNSGGPIIHKDSGRVLGLVTEAVINDTKLDQLAAAAKTSDDSKISDISYFGHRIDTVADWKASTVNDYLQKELVLNAAEIGLEKALLFMIAEDGWQGDRRLDDAWNAYQKFIDSAKDKTTKRVQVTEHVNEFGVVVRRDAKIKGQGIAEADFTKARQVFQRAIEWKILADKEALEKLKPIGYHQVETTKTLLDFAAKLLILHKEL